MKYGREDDRRETRFEIASEVVEDDFTGSPLLVLIYLLRFFTYGNLLLFGMQLVDHLVDGGFQRKQIVVLAVLDCRLMTDRLDIDEMNRDKMNYNLFINKTY